MPLGKGPVPVVVGEAVVDISLDHLAVVCDCLVQHAQLVVGESAVEQTLVKAAYCLEVWTQVERLRVKLHSLLEVAALSCQIPFFVKLLGQSAGFYLLALV